jgi:tetratricopeptide (TPR) repeat protein
MVQAIAKIVEGKKLAKEGKLDAALKSIQEARNIINEARELNLKLPSDLELEIKRFAAPYLLEEGKKQAKEGMMSEAITGFRNAAELDPRLKVRADYWNNLCRWGSLTGKAAEFMPECDKAVTLSHDDGMIRNTRGVARALAGDTKGAIEDFKAYLAQKYPEPRIESLKPKRQRWIAVLRKGEKPITPEEISELSKEGD